MIPTYNQEKYILKCVESALFQTYENIEVIVADDSTNDNTKEILKRFYANPKFLYYRNNKRLGRLANYKNLLEKRASGEYVLMLDGDDFLIDNTYIQRAVDEIIKRPSIVIVKARHTRDINKIVPIVINKPIIKSGQMYIKNVSRFLGEFSHLSTLYHRSMAISSDMYFLNDVFGFIPLSLKGDVCIFNQVVGVWRQTDSNESDKLDSESLSNIFKMPTQLENDKIIKHKYASKIRFYYFFSYMNNILNIKRGNQNFIKEVELLMNADENHLRKYSWIKLILQVLPWKLKGFVIKICLKFSDINI